MKLPWSISTTVRSPERLRSFLQVLKDTEGRVWDNENQKYYQAMLIKERVYGFGNTQFYNASRQCNALTREQIKLLESLEPLTCEQAKEIFETKGYVDPAMRGRQSFNPLEKLGLAVLDNDKIKITPLGEYLLNKDYDLGEMFFRSFIKWQIPNPSSTDYKESEGYNIKPFIGTLHLIAQVNKKWSALNKTAVGISKDEFSLFVPTLINYEKIEEQAQKIINLRLACEGKNIEAQNKLKEKWKIKVAQEFLGTDEPESVEKLLSNLDDYGDNAIRYFRLTRYFFIRGGGFFIDLEPRRQVEITNLLNYDNARSHNFSNEKSYLNYLADIKQPELPWEKEPELIKIVDVTLEDISQQVNELKNRGIVIPAFNFKDKLRLDKDQLKEYIDQLRGYRRGLNNAWLHCESQEISKIEEYIGALRGIYKVERRPVVLEKLVTLSLNALNDALDIKPNYPVGDDNEPTFTAPANKGDIECFYDLFNSVCEVTMLVDRSQWYCEGQPVMRHVRDFENQNRGKDVFCVFVSPKLHRDTINTFWNAVKYEYEGSRQKIVPLTIGQLISLLEVLLKLKIRGSQLKHMQLLNLYKRIIDLTSKIDKSDEWIEKIPVAISEWTEEVLSLD